MAAVGGYGWWAARSPGVRESIGNPATGETPLAEIVKKVEGRSGAPGFELPDRKGVNRGLADFRGRLVLLHFWASWCEPCLDELPKLVEFASAFSGRPLTLVTVTLDERWEDALKVLPDRPDTEGVVALRDPEAKVSKAYGTFEVPETYLIDPQSRLITKWVGPQDWAAAALEGAVSEQLGRH